MAAPDFRECCSWLQEYAELNVVPDGDAGRNHPELIALMAIAGCLHEIHTMVERLVEQQDELLDRLPYPR